MAGGKMAAARLATVLLLAAAAASDLGPSAWTCDGEEHGSRSSSSSEEASAGGQRCACAPEPAHAPASAFAWIALDCSRRGFEGVSAGHQLPYHVRSLDLSWNRIRFLEGGLFDRFRPLERLLLAHNGLLKMADHALAGLTALAILNLGHNDLAALSDDHFMNLSSLKELDLSWNDLRSLPPRLFAQISALDSLSLSGNVKIGQYIHESPLALKDVLQRGLRCLKLNSLQMTDLPENLFNQAYNLKELHVNNNLFTKVPHLYVGSLQTLDISGSNILVLETGNFLYLPSLKILHMNRMRHLSHVEEGAFVGLKHLEELFLEKCPNLTAFDGLAFGGPTYDPPPVHTLSLKHCGLQTLSRRLLPIISAIENVKLQGNPWVCDCKLNWFKEINLTRENEHQIRCYFPQYLRNKTVSSLKSSDFVCAAHKARVLFGLVVSMAILFSLIALLALGAYFDSLRRKYCMQRRSHRIRYNPMMVQLDPSGADNYWDDNDGQATISIIRENRVL